MFKILAVTGAIFLAVIPPSLDAHTLVGNLGGKFFINDDTGTLDPISRSYLFYQSKRDNFAPWQFQFILAGLFNRLEADYQVHDGLSIFASNTSIFTLEGDSQEIDGVDFDQYEFKAHRYGGELGFRVTTSIGGEKILIAPYYGYDYYDIYEKANATNYLTPSHIHDHSISLYVSRDKRQPPYELFELGFYPIGYLAHHFRPGFDGLGLPGNESTKQYLKGSLGGYWSEQLGRSQVLVFGLQGSFVGPTDRLNALRPVTGRAKSLDLFLSDVRSNRALSGEFGPRFYFEQEKYFALRPLIYGAWYNEIFVDRPGRDEFVYGPAIKFMGRVGKKFFYDFLYGAGFGNREDKASLHELRFNLSYQFLSQ